MYLRLLLFESEYRFFFLDFRSVQYLPLVTYFVLIVFGLHSILIEKISKYILRHIVRKLLFCFYCHVDFCIEVYIPTTIHIKMA